MKQCNSHTSSDAKGLRGPGTEYFCNIVCPTPRGCLEQTFTSAAYTVSRCQRGCQVRKLKRSKIDKMEIIPRLLLGPSSGRKHASAFFNHKKLIGGDASQPLLQATGPSNFNICAGFGSQAEVQSWVVGRVKAGLAENFLCLFLGSVVDNHARPNRAAVRLRSNQLHLKPVMVSPHVVAQE